MPKPSQIVDEFRRIMARECGNGCCYESEHPGDVTVQEYTEIRFQADTMLQKHLNAELDRSTKAHAERNR